MEKSAGRWQPGGGARLPAPALRDGAGGAGAPGGGLHRHGGGPGPGGRWPQLRLHSDHQTQIAHARLASQGPAGVGGSFAL